MTTLSSTSTLLDDVYLHHAVDGSGTVRAVTGPDGLVTLFSVGTDGSVHRVAPDAASDTGWSVTDLGAPGDFDVIDVISVGDGSIVVCGGTSSTNELHVLTIAADQSPGAWTTIQPGPDIDGKLTFLDLTLRRTPNGVEIYLLYFQRMLDPRWRYTYRVGRAAATASSWSIGFSLNDVYEGPTPLVPPAMVLREVDSTPTLSLYWREAQTIRSWVGIDGTPVVRDISVPAGSDLRAMFSAAPISGGQLFALGSVTGTAAGVYRVEADGSFTSVAPTVDVVVEIAVAYDDLVGLDVMGRTDGDDLLHLHATPDLATWDAWAPIASRVVGVTGVQQPALATVFFAATRDRTLTHLYRSPSTVDWEVDTVEVSTGQGTKVVWYTTKVSVLDEAHRAVGNQPVTVSCSETAEFLLGDRPEIVGPGRAVVLTTSVVGNLVIRQSTADLANLYVPQLQLSLATGEETTLAAHTAVQDQLYAVTGAELLAATGRDGSPLLPEDQRGNADEIAEKLATCASLGRAPLNPAGTKPSSDVDPTGSGAVVFSPTGGAPVMLSIDIGDFFESVKDGLVGAIDAAVTAIGSEVVTGLDVVVTTANGVYSVFVSTIENAFDAIRTVLEAIGAAFETALEWLGTLFDWTAIRALAGQVAGQLRSGLAGIPQTLSDVGLPGSIPATFADLRSSAAGAFEYIRAEVGLESEGAATTQAGFTNADAVYTFDGINVSNAANWLLDRLTSKIGEIDSSLPIEGPGWSAVDDLWAAVGPQFLTVGEQVASNFVTLYQSLATSDDVLDVLIGTVLDQMQSLADALLTALESIAGSLVSALSSLAAADALVSLLTTPLRIPGVSDMLAVVGLGDLTLLDLISYLVAIPMHVVSTLLGVDDVLQLAETPVGVYLAAGIMFFAIMVFAAIADALAEGKQVLAILPSVLWVALCGLLLYGTLKADEPPLELVLAALFYLGYQVTGLRTNALYFGHASATKKFAIYSIVDAVLMNILAAVWAIRMSRDPNPAKHPKPWQIAANHIGTLPDIFRWPDLVWPPPQTKPLPVRLVVVAVDVIGMGALAAGAIADYIDNRDPRAQASGP